MPKRQYGLIFLISLVFFCLISLIQKTPGYMDASYYYSMGHQIISGDGWHEPFIWNYLSSPEKIPTNSFTYWMPLSALLSAAGMLIFHSVSYWPARFTFILLASCIPVINVYFTTLYSNRKSLLVMSAALGLCSGLYLQYFTITDSFVPFIVFGGVFVILIKKLVSENAQHRVALFLLLGVTAGLLHLTRADGILWLLAGLAATFLLLPRLSFINSLKYSFLIFSGYLLIMSPWYIRNISVFHSLFGKGSNLALFFTQYNDLYSFQAGKISLISLLNSGIGNIVETRLSAFAANFGNLVATFGEIVLFPFMVVGAIILRKDKTMQFSLVMLLGILLIMSLAFPFAGSRGGFIHSASALQCFFWGITPIGFEAAVTKIAKRRKWKSERSIPLLGNTLIAVLVLFTAANFYTKVVRNSSPISWDKTYSEINLLNDHLKSLSYEDSPVMINDSPGYYVMTGRAAIQMTSGSLEDAISAMKQFGCEFLIIDKDHSQEFDRLYNEKRDQDGFRFLDQFDQFVIYRIGK